MVVCDFQGTRSVRTLQRSPIYLMLTFIAFLSVPVCTLLPKFTCHRHTRTGQKPWRFVYTRATVRYEVHTVAIHLKNFLLLITDVIMQFADLEASGEEICHRCLSHCCWESKLENVEPRWMTFVDINVRNDWLYYMQVWLTHKLDTHAADVVYHNVCKVSVEVLCSGSAGCSFVSSHGSRALTALAWLSTVALPMPF